MLKSEIMPQNLIIGFDAKRIVRNATGLGNYGRTLVNDLVAGSPDNWLFRLYAPDRGRDDLREGIIHSSGICLENSSLKIFSYSL